MAAEPLVDAELAHRIVARALDRGGDFAELFCEDRSGFSLSIDESRIERAQRGSDRGAGVRVVTGETTYFAHVDGLAEADLERAADAAAAALSGDRREPQALAADEPVVAQEIETDPATVPPERKAELLAPATSAPGGPAPR
jgi:TldD protein